MKHSTSPTPCRGYFARAPQDRSRIHAGQVLTFQAELSEMPPVIARFAGQLRTAVGKIFAKVREALLPELPPSLLGGFAADVARTRSQLLAENAFLRQQLIVANRSVNRPRLRRCERGVLAFLAARIPSWRSALLIVKPATLIRWHREGFRSFWRAKSKTPSREPRIGAEVAALIRRMAVENRLWGAERIRGELLKLGIRVAKRTVQKYMRRARSPSPSDGQAWQTFLKNHTVWACDFLPTYDIWFRQIFAFVIVDVNTKRVVHIAATRAPTQEWTAQQLRNATAFDAELPRFIIRDNDAKFGSDFDRAAQGVGVRVIRTAIHAPLMNATCERFLGSLRRECLDHVIILGVLHFERVLSEYAAFFNNVRPHQGLTQRVPMGATRSEPAPTPHIQARPVLGGLHHDYTAAA